MSTKIFCHAPRKERRPPSEDLVYQTELQRTAAERKEKEATAQLAREQRRTEAKKALSQRPASPTQTIERKPASSLTEEEITLIVEDIVRNDGKVRIGCRKLHRVAFTSSSVAPEEDVQVVSDLIKRVLRSLSHQLKGFGYDGFPDPTVSAICVAKTLRRMARELAEARREHTELHLMQGKPFNYGPVLKLTKPDLTPVAKIIADVDAANVGFKS